MYHQDHRSSGPRARSRSFEAWPSRRHGPFDVGRFDPIDVLDTDRRGRRRHRRERPLDQGDLRYVLLHLLSERPRHGYDLIKEIENLTGGAYAPSAGVVYPTLTLFEELGYARVVEPGQPKKLYELTDEGRAELAAHQPDVDRLLGRLAHLDRAGDSVDPEVLRASQNVSRALFLRPGRKPWTSDQAKHVADILDRAAAEIEQII